MQLHARCRNKPEIGKSYFPPRLFIFRLPHEHFFTKNRLSMLTFRNDSHGNGLGKHCSTDARERQLPNNVSPPHPTQHFRKSNVMALPVTGRCQAMTKKGARGRWRRRRQAMATATDGQRPVTGNAITLDFRTGVGWDFCNKMCMI